MNRRALSILEVVLALAVLAVSFAAIGELIRTGTRGAAGAEDQTQAQLLCETKVTEIVAGALPPDPASQVPCDEDPDWVYTVEINSTTQPGLVELRVTVERAADLAMRPASFTLTRWMPDPGLTGGNVTNPEATLADAQNKANGKSAAASGGSSGGASGNGGTAAAGGASGGVIGGTGGRTSGGAAGGGRGGQGGTRPGGTGASGGGTRPGGGFGGGQLPGGGQIPSGGGSRPQIPGGFGGRGGGR